MSAHILEVESASDRVWENALLESHLPNFELIQGGPLATETLTAPISKPALKSALERACICARSARDNKAKDIIVLDMRRAHPLYDFFVLTTGASRRQIHNIAEEIDDVLKAEGDVRHGIEGYEASKWIIQDYTDILVHVFDPETRDFYRLEELWSDAPKVDWERY
ncbi:ribosome silencing factor [Telmatocola sphagniphila]|uniref:Ribosomal silencing factor RsfS n=1 Tax=Telmatocola sphagniphila TaxID=1123043 RepID=A0A8E6B992_9BACT|nr:ribosome silencing factor [Telmatocola sphagniphila]QVL32898.1 ribosome silencing factor [Telmatocola sphagniphila]